MKKKSLIVFDIDGTLTDSVKIHIDAFIKTLFEIGVEHVNEDFKSFKHHTDSFISKEIYESDRKELFSESQFIAFEQGLTQKVKANNIKEIKGAKKLIEHLENNTEYGVCYATGSLLKPAKYKLDSIGVDYNEQILISSDNIYDREGIVSKAIEGAKEFYAVKDFHRIISVGDGLWDLLTARNLDLEFIGVGATNKKVLEENGANILLEDLTEFKV